MSGLSLIAAIAMPALAWLIEATDWRTGYLALSGFTLLVGLPIVIFWFRQPPKTAASHSNEDRADQPPSLAGNEANFRSAVSDGRFWLCLACFGGVALPIGGFLSQMQPMLRGDGFTPEMAAAVGSAFALSIAAGRLVGGVLLDRFHPPMVAAVLLTLPALGALLLVSGSDASWIIALLAVFLLGLGQGAEVDFIAFFTVRIFGMRSFAAISATIGASVGVGMALGGSGFAIVHDATGSYDAAIYASVLIYAGAAALALMIRMPPTKTDQ
jgi:predicted MFS family arabinose efflux permease